MRTSTLGWAAVGLGLLLVAASVVSLWVQGTKAQPWGMALSMGLFGLGIAIGTQGMTWSRAPQSSAHRGTAAWGLGLSLAGACCLGAAFGLRSQGELYFLVALELGGSLGLLGSFLPMGRLTLLIPYEIPAPPQQSFGTLAARGALGGLFGLLFAWAFFQVDPLAFELNAHAEMILFTCQDGGCSWPRPGTLSCRDLGSVASEAKRLQCMETGPDLGALAALLAVPIFLIPFAFFERRFTRLTSAWSFAWICCLVIGSAWMAGGLLQSGHCRLVGAEMRVRSACLACTGMSDWICGDARSD